MQIETERLILRPFRESDAADTLEYLRNPVPNCFACMKLDSLEEAEAEMRLRSQDSEYYFAIVLKKLERSSVKLTRRLNVMNQTVNHRQSTHSVHVGC